MLLPQTPSSISDSPIYTINIEGISYSVNLRTFCAIIIKGTLPSSVSIPNSIIVNGMRVLITEIADNAFTRSEGITELHINGDNLIIGESAFQRCPNLRNLHISGTISRIGKFAFHACHELSHVTFDGTINEIGERAFAFCDKLSTIEIPNGTQLGKGVFKFCTSLTKVTLSKEVKSIPVEAFMSCSSLTEVVSPTPIERVEKCAFMDCGALIAINLHDDVQLEDYCFRRTPLDPLWWKTHPKTPKQKEMYSYLDWIKNNLVSGNVLSLSRSIYDSNGVIKNGDSLYSVIKDFNSGTSIHFSISDDCSKHLYYRVFGNHKLFYFPTGAICKRVLLGYPYYMRLLNNGNPIGKAKRQMLLEEGVPMEHILNPRLWMEDYLKHNLDVIATITDAIKGTGFDVTENEIYSLALSLIPTDETWTDKDKNRFNNNYLCLLVRAIESLYNCIDYLYTHSNHISGEYFFEKSRLNYIYLVNLIKFRNNSSTILSL